MAGAKLIVIYPSPRDVSTFERAYTQDHAMEALQGAAASPSAQKVVAHALSISTGGKPVVLVAEEDTKTF